MYELRRIPGYFELPPPPTPIEFDPTSVGGDTIDAISTIGDVEGGGAAAPSSDTGLTQISRRR